MPQGPLPQSLLVRGTSMVSPYIIEATVSHWWRLRTQQHAMPSTRPHTATSTTAVRLGTQQAFPGPLHSSTPYRAMRAWIMPIGLRFQWSATQLQGSVSLRPYHHGTTLLLLFLLCVNRLVVGYDLFPSHWYRPPSLNLARDLVLVLTY